MNANRNIVQILLLVFAVLIAACSGNKKDATNQEAAIEKEQPTVSQGTAREIKTFDNVDPSVKSQINGFLADYFVLNKSLIEDNQDRARAAAKKLSETVSKFDMSKLAGEQMDFYHQQLAKLNQGLKGIDQSADIEETRVELSTVSDAMYALVKAYHPNDSELYLQFCPMAKNGEGANWISNTKEIINPYMGQRMLKCGNTKETL
ncbi:MAG: DUF3347 domain-containing protein [Cyclobacteriaceae bacterium]|jgi:Cu(I)/Ag(I) efflux system membrane fusion protein|nr:hypothetical protein [Cytophagales bacterium]HNP76477.1 DUF3347 domain-containing protein [Cyclobacteriaceae bacterium]